MLGTLLIGAVVFAGAPVDGVLVSPPVVEVNADQPRADMTVTNPGDSPLEILTGALFWSQDDEGRVTLSETAAVSIYPPHVQLAPREQRRLRLTVLERAPVRSAAYRIVLSIRDPATGEEVFALVPAFVVPNQAIESATVNVACSSQERCAVTLANTGSLPVRPARILLVLVSETGEVEQELTAWWVLPGGTRSYPIALESARVRREVRVRVELGDRNLTASAVVAP